MDLLRTCRICKKFADADRMVKYSVRSYGHHACLLARYKTFESGIAWLFSLQSNQLGRFPYHRFAVWLTKIGRDRTRASLIIHAVLARVKEHEADLGLYRNKICRRCKRRRILDCFAEKGKCGPDVCCFCSTPTIFTVPPATSDIRRFGLRVARATSAGRALQRGRRSW